MTAIRPLLSGWPCPWLTVFGRVNERSMLSSLAGVWIPRLTHLLSLYRGRGDRVATADATWFVRSKCAKTISFMRTTYYCHPPPHSTMCNDWFSCLGVLAIRGGSIWNVRHNIQRSNKITLGPRTGQNTPPHKQYKSRLRCTFPCTNQIILSKK